MAFASKDLQLGLDGHVARPPSTGVAGYGSPPGAAVSDADAGTSFAAPCHSSAVDIGRVADGSSFSYTPKVSSYLKGMPPLSNDDLDRLTEVDPCVSQASAMETPDEGSLPVPARLLAGNIHISMSSAIMMPLGHHEVGLDHVPGAGLDDTHLSDRWSSDCAGGEGGRERCLYDDGCTGSELSGPHHLDVPTPVAWEAMLCSSDVDDSSPKTQEMNASLLQGFLLRDMRSPGEPEPQRELVLHDSVMVDRQMQQLELMSQMQHEQLVQLQQQHAAQLQAQQPYIFQQPAPTDWEAEVPAAPYSHFAAPLSQMSAPASSASSSRQAGRLPRQQQPAQPHQHQDRQQRQQTAKPSHASEVAAPSESDRGQWQSIARELRSQMPRLLEQSASSTLSADARKMHNKIIACLSSGQPIEHKLVHSLMRMHAASGAVQVVEYWFDLMPRFNMEHDKVSYANVINACAQRKDVGRAEEWLNRMLAAGVAPNQHCVNAVINACVQADRVDRAEWWFGASQAWDTPVMPNIVSYNTLINAHARAGNPALAEKWLHSLTEANLAPNEVSYGTVINACAEAGDAIRAEYWINHMTSNTQLKPNEFMYNSLIKACMNAGLIDQAEAWADRMKEDGFAWMPVTFNLLINACAKIGRVARAEGHLVTMIESGCVVNRITFNSVINACANKGSSERAEKWFRSMVAADIQPDEVTYGALCKAYARRGDVDKVAETIAMCDGNGIQVNEYFYASLISACAAARPPQPGRAEAAFRSCHGRGLCASRLIRLAKSALGDARADVVCADLGVSTMQPHGAPRRPAPETRSFAGAATSGSFRAGGTNRHGDSHAARGNGGSRRPRAAGSSSQVKRRG